MKRHIGMLPAVLMLLTTTAIAAAIYGETARAQNAPTYGCLSNDSCNSIISNKPSDFWHNYVCIDCHTGPRPNLALSPQEAALLKSPVRFWMVHDQATRHRETRANAQGRTALKKPLSPAMLKLIEQRPAARK